MRQPIIYNGFRLNVHKILTPSRQARKAFPKEFLAFLAPLREADVYTQKEFVLVYEFLPGIAIRKVTDFGGKHPVYRGSCVLR